MEIKDALQKFVDGNPPDISVWKFYLRIYLGEADWDKYLGELKTKIHKQYGDAGANLYYKQVACAIQLPAAERSIKVDPEAPQRLLFGCTAFQQFKEKDWFELLRVVAAKDIEIAQIKKDALALGYIKNIEYQPNTRQAFRWLLDKAEESGDLTPDSRERLAALVHIYGGAVISSIFTRHEEFVKKVVNWRTGYFFERQVFQVYKRDEILKIKKKELDTSNQRLVTRI